MNCTILHSWQFSRSLKLQLQMTIASDCSAILVTLDKLSLDFRWSDELFEKPRDYLSKATKIAEQSEAIWICNFSERKIAKNAILYKYCWNHESTISLQGLS